MSAQLCWCERGGTGSPGTTLRCLTIALLFVLKLVVSHVVLRSTAVYSANLGFSYHKSVSVLLSTPTSTEFTGFF